MPQLCTARRRRPRRLRRPVVVGVEDRRRSGRARGLAVGLEQVVQLGLDAGGDEAHVDVDRRLVGAAQEDGAVVAHLGDRRLERMGRVVDAVGAVGKARAFGVEVRERGHHRRRAGAGEALFARHEGELAELVADARIGERLDREDDVEVGRIGDRVVEADGRIARRDQPVRRPPRDAPQRHLAGVNGHGEPARFASRDSPRRATRRLMPCRRAARRGTGARRTGRRPGRRACGRAPSGRRTAARCWACAATRRRAALRREEDLQRRVDAEQVRQPLEQMAVERRDLALLPLVERGAGDAEQRRLLGDRQLPGVGEAKEGAQRRRRRRAPTSGRRQEHRA